MPDSVLKAVLSSNWGLPVALGVAFVPAALGYYKKIWAISVGYGFSVAAVAGAALAAGPAPVAAGHSLGLVCHGVRLSTFLFRREIEVSKRPKAGPEWKKKYDKFEGESEKSIIQRIVKRTPLVASVSLLYVCMAAPCLYTLAAPSSSALALAGLGMQWLGWMYNALADEQKSAYKRQLGDEAAWCSTGLYKYSRHPNYFGEQVFWLGTFVAGVPSYSGPVQWLVSLLGLVGIQGIMSGATKRLDRQQEERYGADQRYRAYVIGTNRSVPKLF